MPEEQTLIKSTYMEFARPEENSNKFYYIALEENNNIYRVMARHGRKGKTGRTVLIYTGGSVQSNQIYESQLRKKLSKGYVVVKVPRGFRTAETIVHELPKEGQSSPTVKRKLESTFPMSKLSRIFD